MRVVPKPWGHEKRVFMDDLNDAWLMHFAKEGDASSLHRHPNKRKVLIVLRGSAWLQRGSHWYGPMKQYETQVVERGVLHRQRAAEPFTEILEIESPPNKIDIERFSDQYGRVGQPYEDADANSK